MTSVKIVPWSTDLLVSAGGDNTVRVWQFVQGKEIQCFPVKEYINNYMPEVKKVMHDWAKTCTYIRI